jgi:hypothetical protein
LVGVEPFQHLGHAVDGLRTRLADVVGLVVDADMQVLATPDHRVEGVGVVAVVVALGDLAHVGLVVAYAPPPQRLRCRADFSAT